MSKLFYSDSGRTVRFLNEELSCRRHAQKRFTLPSNISSGGTLYIYCQSHPGCRLPLNICVNGNSFTFEPGDIGFMHWFSLPLKAENLCVGANIIELWSEDIAMDGWILGIDGTVKNKNSKLSLDRGKNWQNDFMTIHHCLRGEYIIRLRLNDLNLNDPAPPEIIWPDPDSLIFKELIKAIPGEIQKIKDQWEKALALSSWTTTQWDYRNSNQGVEYAPWDPLTILSWGKNAYGQEKKDPVTMCVHYGIVFASAAMALGIPARLICCTDEFNSNAGHFVSEVWIGKWRKWCQVDANSDLTYVNNGIPMSVGELYEKGTFLKKLAVKGTGFAHHSEYMRRFVEESLLTGKSFKFWAVWLRNDFCENPKVRLPSHGVGCYAETEWVWAKPAKGELHGMFPYHLEQNLLKKEPPEKWRNI